MAYSEHLEVPLDGVNCPRIDVGDIQCPSDGMLGFGGFSDVIKGKYKGLVVAVKIIDRFKFTNNQEKQVLACKEARAMCAVKHQSIVELFGIVMDQPTRTYGIVIEFMKHGSLRDLNFKIDGRLPLSLKVEMMSSIADALRYLHIETSTKPRLIHADVKMDNILVNERLKAKLGDFGISKLQGFTSRVTSCRRPQGTVTHMAPELFAPELAELLLPKPSCETDVWSFGITMYEILKGDTPFEGLPDAVVVNQIQKGIRLACSQQLEDSAPETLKTLILECLELMPGNRPDFERIESVLKTDYETHYKDARDEDFKTVLQILETTNDEIPFQVDNEDSGIEERTDVPNENEALAAPEPPPEEPRKKKQDVAHRVAREWRRFSRRVKKNF